MISFFIHDEFGRITLTGTMNQEMAEHQVGLGQTLVEGVADARNQYVVDSVLVDIPAAPSPDHTWDWGEKRWFDQRTLIDAKATKSAEINAARILANQDTFMYAGHPIACDPDSRLDIESVTSEIMLTGAMPSGWTGTWKAKDNVDVAVATKAAWIVLYKAMTTLSKLNFAHAQTLKATLAAATTRAEVDAIVVEF